MLFKQIRTVSLDKNHLFFGLSKNNYYAATSLTRAFPLVCRPVDMKTRICARLKNISL